MCADHAVCLFTIDKGGEHCKQSRLNGENMIWAGKAEPFVFAADAILEANHSTIRPILPGIGT